MSICCEFLLLYLVALKAVRKSEILGLSLDGPPSSPTFFSVTYCMNLVILLFWIFLASLFFMVLFLFLGLKQVKMLSLGIFRGIKGQ